MFDNLTVIQEVGLIVIFSLLYFAFVLTIARRVGKYGEGIGCIYAFLIIVVVICLLLLVRCKVSNL